MKSLNQFSRRQVIAAAGALATSSVSMRLAAQSPSDKTVKFILPVGAGSGVDGITRAAQAALGKALQASVVIENQPGAGGVVGTNALTKSAPDGLTLSMV